LHAPEESLYLDSLDLISAKPSYNLQSLLAICEAFLQSTTIQEPLGTLELLSASETSFSQLIRQIQALRTFASLIFDSESDLQPFLYAIALARAFIIR
jgi:hypothetical protein